MEYIELLDIGRIAVRRGLSIKYMRVQMAVGRGIWVNVPLGVSNKRVMNFLEYNRDWIIENQKKLNVYELDTSLKFQIGAEITTREHLFKIVETINPKSSYKLEQQTLTLFISQGTSSKKSERIVKLFLFDIYRLESQSYFPQQVKYYAEKFGFKYGKLSFRNNVSNWGSCSHENNISLNIKLMQMPDEIIDYVILHELCHTVEKNHSADFWKLVGKVCPNYAELRVKLKKYTTRI